MRMISERTAMFFRDQLARHIAEFLDDPDGMCGNDAKEIAKHHDTLDLACRDVGLDFWNVVAEEKRSGSEIKRLKEYLEAANYTTTLMYERGYRHGLEGLNPSSTGSDYMKGYGEGRRTRIENKLRYGDS